ncbi:crotonase/enoyl-CoA hydratase family protein [Chelativorans sp. YIM 93263]|uniref:crotonase/enoyl-CoA hydratase family protein n=1 Tax=Chelativorans sp. YIM 93263 TaxID=2906648 RepID=UPI002379C771|nr:crotonase/enoyl-CoA hydratase family protein [Chelativorans sp. YIM 93263]
MSAHILVERFGAVQIIRMNRPEKKNAISREMYSAMTEALTDGDDRSAIHCHVLFGLPGTFSAGADIADFQDAATGGEPGAEALDFLLTLARCEKPIISGVDGTAVGIGTTMNFHCDLTFATPRTVFRTPFVDLGLVPEAGSSLLAPQILGPQKAFALLALGEDLGAEEAREAGFVYSVVASSKLEDSVLSTAKLLAAKPPEALRITRDLIRGPRNDLLARICKESEHFEARLHSDEARAAFAAFMRRKREMV